MDRKDLYQMALALYSPDLLKGPGTKEEAEQVIEYLKLLINLQRGE